MRAYVIFRILGIILLVEGLCILICGILCIVDGNEIWTGMIYSASINILIGGLTVIFTPKLIEFNIRESLIIIVFGWLMVSFMGALPFIFTKTIPNFTNAIFESVSGFTTTGASILQDVESLPRGILLWRSITHFLGGMGIILFALAIIPMVGAGGMTLLRSENPLLSQDRATPSLFDWLRIIFLIYVGLITIETLLLMIAGLSLFDAINHSFASIATGGFSTKNQSLQSFNNVYADIIVTISMFAGGMNFAIYYHLLRKRFRTVIHREDFLFYTIFIASAILLITLVNYLNNTYDSIFSSLRYSAFNVVSANTTTGFANDDFDKWRIFSKIFLILLMLIGASAGSTCGAIKNIRIFILWKCAIREIKKMLHPAGVFVVHINGKRIEELDLLNTIVFVATYLLIFLIITLLVLGTGLDFTSAFSGTAATMGGVGPGLNVLGPMQNYGSISPIAKWLFILAMILGRLEIFTFLSVIHPHFWLHSKIKWRSTQK